MSGSSGRTALRMGELATATGVHRETLRYYERRGLIAEPDRTLGGHRAYPAEAVTQVRVIKAAQRLGFTLDEVADLIEAGRHPRTRRRGQSGLQSRVADKVAEIDARIDDLTVMRRSLLKAAGAGCDDLHACADDPDCPIPFTTLVEHRVRPGRPR